MHTHPVPSAVLKKGDFGSLMLRKIAELEDRSGIRLGLAQKILLAETGTVEQVLSILTGSLIRVRVVEQKENKKIIVRRSLITDDAGKTLIRASSKIFIHNLPAKVVKQIKRKESGIGTIISSAGLETFRKIVEVGYDPASRSVFRKYQIICRKKVAFEITEELIGIESGPGGIKEYDLSTL
jgi:chorismate-pyruvate lyase